MSKPILKIEVTKNVASNKVSILGTPEQEEVRTMEYNVKDAVVHMLAEQYIKEFGHRILGEISPQIIAEEVKKAVAKKIYE